MRTASPKNGFRALADCARGSVMIVGKYPIFMRQRNQRLVLIEPHEKGGGWFSEPWKLP